jgi:hypothetical protein
MAQIRIDDNDLNGILNSLPQLFLEGCLIMGFVDLGGVLADKEAIMLAVEAESFSPQN